MTKTAGGAITLLCLRYLHRHPAELDHLPGAVLIDLIAYSRLATPEQEE